MYKSQLQELCQRRQWSLPDYAVTRDGPDHNPCFLASVTVNGDRFSSSVSSSSSKEAQNKAAKVAFEKLFSSEPPPAPAPSLARASFGVVPPLPSPEGSVEDAMYKSKLQELCQRRRWAFPGYAVTRDGPDHNPSFLASVTVNGEEFSCSISSSSSKRPRTRPLRWPSRSSFSPLLRRLPCQGLPLASAISSVPPCLPVPPRRSRTRRWPSKSSLSPHLLRCRACHGLPFLNQVLLRRPMRDRCVRSSYRCYASGVVGRCQSTQ